MKRGDFDGKVVIVTGAASGFGRATAYAFAPARSNLALVDIDGGGLEETVAKIRELGREATAIPTDICDAAACAAVAARVVDASGRLDALCNIAGIFRFEHAADIGPDSWDRVAA